MVYSMYTIIFINNISLPIFFQKIPKCYFKMDSRVIQILVGVLIVVSYASSKLPSNKVPSIKKTPLINKRRLCIQLTSVSSSVTPLASLMVPDQHGCMMKCAHNKGCSAFKYTSSSNMCTLVRPVKIIKGDTAPQFQYSKLVTCTSLLPLPALPASGGSVSEAESVGIATL